MQQERSRLHYERLRRIRRRSWPSGYKGISVESPHIHFDQSDEDMSALRSRAFEPLRSTMMNAQIAHPHIVFSDSRASPQTESLAKQEEKDVFVA